MVLITDGAESCACAGHLRLRPGPGGLQVRQPRRSTASTRCRSSPSGFRSRWPMRRRSSPVSRMIPVVIYYGAKNAAELSDALYEVFYTLQTEARSFTPFKVSPPPSASSSDQGGPGLAGGLSLLPAGTQEVAVERQPVRVPVYKRKPVDPDQRQLSDRLLHRWLSRRSAATPGTPTRGWRSSWLPSTSPARPVTSLWAAISRAAGRATIWRRFPPTPPCRPSSRDLLDVTGGITNLKTQEVVNFVRGVWMDDDDIGLPRPRTRARGPPAHRHWVISTTRNRWW